MKPLRFWSLILVVLAGIALFLAPQGYAQEKSGLQQRVATPASDSQAVFLVSEAQGALTGNTPVADLLLKADLNWIAGGTKSSGIAVLKAKGSKAARVDISGDSIKRTEMHNHTNGPDGRWAGADGTNHTIAMHNCWTPAAWFAPHAIVQEMTEPDAVLQFIGQEIRGEVAVDHVRMYRANNEKNPQLMRDLERLSRIEVFFDAKSHLPVAMVFDTHPDNDANRDIPIEIRFGDYHTTSGFMVPFHIQRFIQGVLNADLTITSVAVNSGLVETEFALQ